MEYNTEIRTNKDEEKSRNFFGYFWDYLREDDIANVDYDSGELWIEYENGIRKRVDEETRINSAFLEAFCRRARNSIGAEFSPASPILETEFDSARIIMLHENVSVNARTINIRKVTKQPIHTPNSIIESGYVSREVMNFLVNCVKAKCTMTVSGLTDVGKTEFSKFLSSFIPPYEKVVTVEDRKEWYFKEFMPDNDCISLIKSDYMNESEAIRCALRLNPNWLMFQEVRGVEANELVSGWSTGIPGITTLHSKDAESDPYRLMNMMGRYATATINDVYDYLDCSVHIKRKDLPDGTKKRFVDQVALFTNEKNKEKSILIVDNGKIITEELTKDIVKKFSDSNVVDPFESDRLKECMAKEKTS